MPDAEPRRGVTDDAFGVSRSQQTTDTQLVEAVGNADELQNFSSAGVRP